LAIGGHNIVGDFTQIGVGADDEVHFTGCGDFDQSSSTFSAAQRARCDLVDALFSLDGADDPFLRKLLALGGYRGRGEQRDRSEEEGGVF